MVHAGLQTFININVKKCGNYTLQTKSAVPMRTMVAPQAAAVR